MNPDDVLSSAILLQGLAFAAMWISSIKAVRESKLAVFILVVTAAGLTGGALLALFHYFSIRT